MKRVLPPRLNLERGKKGLILICQTLHLPCFSFKDVMFYLLVTKKCVCIKMEVSIYFYVFRLTFFFSEQ